MTIGIILLAAGEGKRFGGGKLAAEMNGIPMYKLALEKIKELSAVKVVVVAAPGMIADGARNEGFRVVENPHPEMGISHSIQLGIDALASERVEGVMFMVCDQPWLRVDTLEKMTAAFDGGILALRCGPQKGNPVIFSREYLEELRTLSGDRGGRQVMEKHWDHVVFFETQRPEELWDVDRKEDLKKL